MRTFVVETPSAVFMIRDDNGVITDANVIAKNLIGLPSMEAVRQISQVGGTWEEITGREQDPWAK